MHKEFGYLGSLLSETSADTPQTYSRISQFNY